MIIVVASSYQLLSESIVLDFQLCLIYSYFLAWIVTHIASVVRVGIGTGAGVKNMSLESKVKELLEEAKDMTKLDRAIAGYKTELSRIHADINKLRPRLHAITMASPWPLCKDWEIRTDALFEKTGKVYFVNHKEKTTTYECPPPPEPGETQFHANAMPEYRAFVSQLVKLIERYNKMTSKLELYSIAEKHGHNIASNAPGKFDSIRQQLVSLSILFF